MGIATVFKDLIRRHLRGELPNKLQKNKILAMNVSLNMDVTTVTILFAMPAPEMLLLEYSL